PGSSGPSWGSDTPAFGSVPDPFASPASASPFTSDAFASEQPSRASLLAQGKTPVGWSAAACVVAFAGAMLAIVAVLTGSVAYAFVGWALSGPAAALVLAKYMITDTKERALPVYQPSNPSQVVYWTAVGFAALGVLVS